MMDVLITALAILLICAIALLIVGFVLGLVLLLMGEIKDL